MTHLGKWLGVLVAGCLVGCGPVTTEEEMELAVGTPGEAQATAARIEELLNQEQMHAMEACPAPYTCPSEYKPYVSGSTSCTGALSTCDVTSMACRVCELGPNGKPQCEYLGGQRQSYQYNWTFGKNSAGQECRSVTISYNTYCGCNGL